MAVRIKKGKGIVRVSQIAKSRPARRAREPELRPRHPDRTRLELPKPTKTVLSILIPTVPGREPKLRKLLASLDPQVHTRSDVELIVLRDNRRITIGAKRNAMLRLSHGDYVAFCDDDDAVAGDYVSAICRSLAQKRPDVLCFTVRVEGHGAPKPCRYHPDFYHMTLPHEYRRQPNHIMVWRRDLALRVPFPEVKIGEDTSWATSMAPLAVEVTTLDRELYVYRYDVHDNSSLG